MDFTHLYKTKPLKSVDEDLAEINETFRDLHKKGKNSLKLVNYYHGLPLSFPAQMVSFDHGMLDLDVHPQQAVAIERSHYAFIRCDAFKSDICASVQYVNAQKRAATLTKFFYIDIMAEKRNSIRLRLGTPTDASFDCNSNSPVSGKLVDLSMGGIAIVAGNEPECERGQQSHIQFMLPNIIQNNLINISTTGTLLGVRDEDKSVLCTFAISADNALEQQISKYIFQRQVEIIQELRDASF